MQVLTHRPDSLDTPHPDSLDIHHQDSQDIHHLVNTPLLDNLGILPLDNKDTLHPANQVILLQARLDILHQGSKDTHLPQELQSLTNQVHTNLHQWSNKQHQYNTKQ